MNREQFKAECLKASVPNPRPLPAHDLARLALDRFYDQGQHMDRPDIAVYLIDMEYCGFASECHTAFYDMRARLPYGIDSQADITDIAYSIAQDSFGRKDAHDAARDRINQMTEEFEAYQDVQAQTRQYLDQAAANYAAWSEDLEIASQTDTGHYYELLASEPTAPAHLISWDEEAKNHMY